MSKHSYVTALGCAAVCLAAGSAQGEAAADPLRDKAAQALRRACAYLDVRVSTEGGYLWQYSEDLSQRAGETLAPPTAVWVQPPGTPSVGMAFLRAHHATKDVYYLELAKKAGDCLRRGQLRSGGWTYRIDFDPAARRKVAYRADAAGLADDALNISVLDDNTTQAALTFLMHLDEALEFKEVRIHEAAEYGLGKLLEAQYPIGAWPQRFAAPPDPARFPVKKASFPGTWSRTFPAVPYYEHYTFNDNAMADTLALMFLAAKVYQQPRYREAAERCGQFILLAQLPEPQPAWAQQYDADMQPAWARKFEPPAVTGCESQDVLETLLKLYEETGDRKYLEPVPRALEYLKRSALPDGRLARFYELRTNRPLYFTKDYRLIYEDNDVPTHYSFKVASELPKIEAQYRNVLQADARELETRRQKSKWKGSRPKTSEVTRVIGALDSQGRWLEDGKAEKAKRALPEGKVLSCSTFIRNANVLSNFLAE